MLTVKVYHWKRRQVNIKPRGKTSGRVPVALSSCGVRTVSLPASVCNQWDEAWLMGGG